jgi:hypothetical protein
VQRVVAALQADGIEVALGGSGLLLAHGLVDSVRDWDLTTEGEPARVEAALVTAGIEFEGSLGDTESYGTRWRIMIDAGDHDIDLMIGFSIRQPVGNVAIPTIVRDSWNDLPLGSLEVWLVAYRLMVRPEKPDLIAAHLRTHGADPAIVRQLLEQPLPDDLRNELSVISRN